MYAIACVLALACGLIVTMRARTLRLMFMLFSFSMALSSCLDNDVDSSRLATSVSNSPNASVEQTEGRNMSSRVGDASSPPQLNENKPWPFQKPQVWFVENSLRLRNSSNVDPAQTIVKHDNSLVTVELWEKGSRTPTTRSDYLFKVIYNGSTGEVVSSMSGN